MKTTKRKAPVAAGADESYFASDYAPNSAEAQRARILERLRQGPATTVQLRRDLDVMMPAARIFELRHNFGEKINTNWEMAETHGGRLHRVALYCLETRGAK